MAVAVRKTQKTSQNKPPKPAPAPITRAKPPRLQAILPVVLVAASLAYLGLYLVLAGLRISYPFALEFLEGASIDYIARLASHDTFYCKPSLEWIPCNYTPLYFSMAALLAKVLGLGFLPLRLLSLLSIFGCFVLIYLFARHETANWKWGVLASGVFAASYAHNGAWFEISRPDSLFLLLTLAACYIVRTRSSVASGILAGAVFALGYYAKQTVGVIAPWVILYSLIEKRRQGIALAASLGLLGGISFLALNSYYDGWFRYYTLRVAGLHAFVPANLLKYGPPETLPVFFVTFVLGGVYLYRLFREKQREPLLFHLLLGAAMVGTSWYIRVCEGAYVNVLMPACAQLAILFAVSLDGLVKRASVLRWRMLPAMVLLAGVGQLALLAYNPVRVVPTRSDLEAGQEFTRQLAAMAGNVYVFNHGYIARRVGKTSYAHPINIGDVLADKGQWHPDGLTGDIENNFGSKRFDAIIFDTDPAGNFVCKPTSVDPFYEPKERMHYTPDRRAFRPLTGTSSRPEVVFRPRP